MTIKLSDAVWDRISLSAERQGISIEAYISRVLTEKPPTGELLRVDWITAHLRELAAVIPQVGPARDKIEALILSINPP